ncbi:thiosulfate oxidation carrier complex protein SoxZ [Thalassobaculum sp.]|uniref:thiosulfate oxidation carrier complex protein SoxZ n=1 Tax=Thalassobaculum sp. TaxID=2022740 RepID=UPI0032EEE6D6
MALVAARVSLPSEAKRGEIIEIKALIRHPMETGYRVDARGQRIPRHIVRRFEVAYDGEPVFAMDLTQGVAANPFVAFTTVATASGELVFTWEDDRGEVVTVTKSLTVTG